MKKIISLLMVSLILIFSIPYASASENLWEIAYRKVADTNNISAGLVIDLSSDKIPELIIQSGSKVMIYFANESTPVKAYESADIPFTFFKNLKRLHSSDKNETNFFGQAIHNGVLYSYRMHFNNFVPTLDIFAEENLTTSIGSFKGDGDVFVSSSDVTEQVREYLSDYTEEYVYRASILPEETQMFGKSAGLTRAFGRYNLFTGISDNSISFSANRRETIKKNITYENFLEFHRISVLNDTSIFVEFFVNDTQNSKVILPYEERYALIDGDLALIEAYREEKNIDATKLIPLITVENAPSNVNFDYKKCASFRGIDDYASYLSQVLSPIDTVNANGKKNLAQFLEYAVNKCSRTQIKAVNNTLTIKKKSVSMVAENAGLSMKQLLSVCTSKNISQIRTARTIPELVCTGLDFSAPIRIEFADGIAKTLSSASGIRIMLDDSHGIYLNTAELALLEESADTFCIEYTKNKNDYSIVFTDGKSRKIDEIYSPVWVIVPAKYEFSSVLASFEGGTENRGGTYDPNTSTMEFSVVRSGNYQVIEDDITINDTDRLPISTSEAIRFLVSKGIFDLDEKNNFHPEENMTRYEFDDALFRMFYQGQSEEDSEKLRLTKEYMLASCGKILVQKKGYQCPENYMDYILFPDKTDITEDNLPYIAVAVQCGLSENSGEFLPESFVTRAEAAEVLYKTYMLLYDPAEITTALSAEEEPPKPAYTMSDLDFLPRLGLCVLVTAIVCVFVLIGKRKGKNNK